MKTPKKSTTSKLVARFDNELKRILMNDLSSVKNARLINTIQNSLNNRLNAA